MCADFAIRNKETGNHHVHIMLNVRPLKEDGAWARSAVRHIDWNDKGNVEIWRAAWRPISADKLEAAN